MPLSPLSALCLLFPEGSQNRGPRELCFPTRMLTWFVPTVFILTSGNLPGASEGETPGAGEGFGRQGIRDGGERGPRPV